MTEDDFRDQLAQEDFQAHLREISTDQIKFDLETNRIASPDSRALAKIELERRAEKCSLARTKKDLADCRRQLRIQKAATGAAIIAAVALALIANAAL